MQQIPRKNGFKLPECLETAEVNALIAATPQGKADHAGTVASRNAVCPKPWPWKLGTLHLDSDRPTLVFRQGKGRKARVVPVHPELQTALTAAISFGTVGQGRLIGVSRVTAWRWVQQAVRRDTEAGQIPQNRVVGTHTLSHSLPGTCCSMGFR